MPIRPTKHTTTVSLDLPADLMERVRAYAEKDMRTIKAVFILALEHYLASRPHPVTELPTRGAAGETMTTPQSPPPTPRPRPGSR